MKRLKLLLILATMPEEAFSWFVLACPQSAMLKGGNAQIWPDGIGGFSKESKLSINAIREEVDLYLKAE